MGSLVTTPFGAQVARDHSFLHFLITFLLLLWIYFVARLWTSWWSVASTPFVDGGCSVLVTCSRRGFGTRHPYLSSRSHVPRRIHTPIHVRRSIPSRTCRSPCLTCQIRRSPCQTCRIRVPRIPIRNRRSRNGFRRSSPCRTCRSQIRVHRIHGHRSRIHRSSHCRIRIRSGHRNPIRIRGHRSHVRRSIPCRTCQIPCPCRTCWRRSTRAWAWT